MTKVKAILTSTIVVTPALVWVRKYEGTKDSLHELCAGVPHYVGHPATREIVESLDAIKAPTNLFEGLEVSETALIFRIAQGKSSRRATGITIDQAVTMADLEVLAMTRLDESCMIQACRNCAGRNAGEVCNASLLYR